MMAGWLRLTLVIGLALLGLDSGEALAAGAAYQVDTADVSDVGACKVESWASFAANHDFIGATAPACVFNFGRGRVEVSSQFDRLRQSDEWSSIATPKLKTNLIPTAIGSWGVAATVQSTYDLISGGNLATAAAIPATFRFNDAVRVNLNAGWLWDRVADKHYLTYGAGLDWRTPDNVWTLTGEVFGQTGNSAEDSGTVRPRFQLGIRWRPVDRFNIDIIYGRNLGGEQANWITLANTIRFEAKLSRIKLPPPRASHGMTRTLVVRWNAKGCSIVV